MFGDVDQCIYALTIITEVSIPKRMYAYKIRNGLLGGRGCNKEVGTVVDLPSDDVDIDKMDRPTDLMCISHYFLKSTNRMINLIELAAVATAILEQVDTMRKYVRNEIEINHT